MRRMSNPSLRIDNARYVLTLDRERRIVAGGSILVENGRISRVGKAAELAQAPADRVIDARHFVVTPGFVNGHMHISYGHVVRGIFPDDVGTSSTWSIPVTGSSGAARASCPTRSRSAAST